jgi:hypothetical protein
MLTIVERAFGESHPRVADALSFLVNMQIRVGDYASAEPLLDRWRRIDPDGAGHVFETARLELGRGNLAKADTLFSLWLEAMAMENGEDSPAFAHSKARYRILRGDSEAALEFLQLALDRGFKDPWLTRNRDFAPLFGDPRFQRILDEVRSRAGIG